jgi:hypothetical protein
MAVKLERNEDFIFNPTPVISRMDNANAAKHDAEKRFERDERKRRFWLETLPTGLVIFFLSFCAYVLATRQPVAQPQPVRIKSEMSRDEIKALHVMPLTGEKRK